MRRIVLFVLPLLSLTLSGPAKSSAQTVEVEGVAQAALLAERAVQLSALQTEIAKLQKELGLTEPQLQIHAEFIEVEVSLLPPSKTDRGARSVIYNHLQTDGARSTDTIPIVACDADSTLLKQLKLWRGAAVKIVEVIGDPTVTTLVGKPALVRNGSEIPLLVPSASGESKVENRFQGVQLEVIGQLRFDGKVQLQLRPRHTEFDFKQSVTFGGQEVPAMTVKECDKQITITPGQTVVIGGMTRPRTVTTEPARFLKPAKTEVKQIELLVVVTVTIIHPKPTAVAHDPKTNSVR